MSDKYSRSVETNANEKLNISGVPIRKEIDIDCLFSVLYLKYTKSYSFEGERHNFWEMVYVDSGEVTIESDGDSFVLSQAQFFLHAPDEFHKVRANNQFCNTIVISFNSQSPKLTELTKSVHTATKFQKQLLNTALHEGKKVMAKQCDYYNEYRPSTILDEQAVKNALELFYIYAFKPNEEAESEAKNSKYSDALLQEILNYLQLNIGEKLDYDNLVQHTEYSASYISKFFKRHLGVSVFQYFIDLKIRRAKELIAMNKYTVQEISELLGFDTVQYFCYRFKQSTHMTPTQFAKSMENERLLNPTELNWSNMKRIF